MRGRDVAVIIIIDCSRGSSWLKQQDNGIISPQLVSLIDAIRSPTEFALGKLEHKRKRGAQGEGGADAEEEG